MGIKVKHKKYFIVISVLILIVATLFFVKFKSFEKVDDFIIETVDVYIPSKKLVSHKREFSIDTFDYWIFSLDNKEKNELINDINENDWVVMNSLHISRLDEVKFIGDNNTIPSVIPSAILDHTCYIYIYDLDNNKNITNQENSFWENDCFDWCVFIYDSDTEYYYLIHETM